MKVPFNADRMGHLALDYSFSRRSVKILQKQPPTAHQLQAVHQCRWVISMITVVSVCQKSQYIYTFCYQLPHTFCLYYQNLPAIIEGVQCVYSI